MLLDGCERCMHVIIYCDIIYALDSQVQLNYSIPAPPPYVGGDSILPGIPVKGIPGLLPQFDLEIPRSYGFRLAAFCRLLVPNGFPAFVAFWTKHSLRLFGSVACFQLVKQSTEAFGTYFGYHARHQCPAYSFPMPGQCLTSQQYSAYCFLGYL